jgi:signal transduction histidine kinase
MLARSDGLPLPYSPSRFVDESVAGASRRLRALAALSGSLTDSLDPTQAATVVEQEALSALGATSAVVVTLGPFPPAASPSGHANASPADAILHVVHAIGLPAELAAALEQMPLASPVPLAEVARSGEAVFLSSEKELRHYAHWGAAMIRAGARAAAIVPVWANGELRGVLGLTWPLPRIFDEDERAFVLTLGVMCAQAIMRAHLKAAERDARDAAERANQSKARFVAMVSHELRTPLTAVLGYTALVADEVDGPVTAIQKEHLERVRTSTSHLLGLIGDLLSFARAEGGEDVVQAERVLVADVVEESLALVRPQALKKGLSFRVETLEESMELCTDRRKLRQILVNLLANAVKFTDAGEVALRLRVTGRGAELTAFLEVTDTGCGIARTDQAHIFSPFWQADRSSNDGATGTGLGLSVAQRLARLLGGDLTLARSVIGHGSTFVVSLPARYTA